MIQSPCKDCEERHTACHDTCEKYREFKDKLNAVNEKRKEDARKRNADMERSFMLAKFKKKGLKK